MGDLVSEIFTGFTTTITGLAGGIKTAFSTLLYVDPDATTKVVSDPVKFCLTFLGVGLATGILYKMFGLIRRRG